MKRLKLVGWQGFAGMVVGTLDMALWDALARAMDVPLAVLLGGERRPLPAYDSFGLLDHRTDLSTTDPGVMRDRQKAQKSIYSNAMISDRARLRDGICTRDSVRRV